MVSLHYVSTITVWLAALQGRGAMNPTTSALKNILFVGGLSQPGPQYWNRGNLPKYLTERDLNKNKRLCHFDMLQFYLNVFECIWCLFILIHTVMVALLIIPVVELVEQDVIRIFSLHEEDGQHQPEQLLLRVRPWEQPQRCQTCTDVRRTCRKS